MSEFYPAGYSILEEKPVEGGWCLKYIRPDGARRYAVGVDLKETREFLRGLMRTGVA